MEEEVKEDIRTDEELDKLADNADVTPSATNSERPMKEEPSKEEAKSEDTFEFVHNGKSVKGTKEQILKWASQGYNYPQLVQKLNSEKAKFSEERQGWEKKWGIYKEIDEYARKNQEWWNFVNQNWQTRGNPPSQAQPAGQTLSTPANDPYATKFQSLEQKLSQLEPVIQSLAEQKQMMEERADDEKLEKEIQSIRSQHSDLDWDSYDNDGKSLELKVLEHAQEIGTKSFKAAFRDLLHEELIQKASAQGKLAVAKGIQNRTKLGVLGEKPTPERMMPKKDIRHTSYEELEEEIREELKRGRLA